MINKFISSSDFSLPAGPASPFGPCGPITPCIMTLGHCCSLDVLESTAVEFDVVSPDSCLLGRAVARVIHESRIILSAISVAIDVSSCSLDEIVFLSQHVILFFYTPWCRDAFLRKWSCTGVITRDGLGICTSTAVKYYRDSLISYIYFGVFTRDGLCILILL